MPTVQYEVQKNSITKPPSYFPRVVPRAILNREAIAKLINEKNPGLPVQTVITILETLRTVVMEQVSGGSTCTIEKFLSFQPKLSGKMVNSTDPLPSDSFTINTVVSDPFQKELTNYASFEKLGVAEKSPSIAAATDTNTGILALVRENKGFKIDGAQMQYNPATADEGVFLISSNASVRQENITYNNNKLQYIIPTLDAGISSPNVEYQLQIATRYTENGQLRTGVFGQKLRTVNVISDTTTDQVFAVGAAAGPATLDYVGAQVDAILRAQIDNDNVLYVSVGDIDQNFGPELAVTENAAYVLTGLASDVTMTVTDYDTLYASVKAYGRYMKEVIDLSPLTP